jgi:hypothetical protein
MHYYSLQVIFYPCSRLLLAIILVCIGRRWFEPPWWHRLPDLVAQAFGAAKFAITFLGFLGFLGFVVFEADASGASAAGLVNLVLRDVIVGVLDG